MEGLFTFENIKGLQNLLSQTSKNSDDDVTQSVPTTSGSSDTKSCKKEDGYEVSCGSSVQRECADIWHAAETKKFQYFQQQRDPRVRPEYQIKYKQSLGTQDVFLGMGFKTPGTASCEWLSLTIKLPKENRDKVQLTVKSDLVDLRSPKYRLVLPTPHKVDPNVSSARWFRETYTLEISLKLVRELDAINF
ncbi:dynein axonemal assembly factor 6 [Leptopilina heterotoma]|uniref:dynein axonemal assembly factor 6 n=1 Tax=Leptopilina heterotoma TaxID=63436 RepID=UPI001CAA225D|nr:dynein axonemal assembly factor 6 [Leptopilina heterotoma]